MEEIVEVVENFITPLIPKPFKLFAVEWRKLGGDMVLSILVDKEGGIEIDETAELSELISPLLDQIKPDPFPKEGYMLEVASPGAERPLRKAEHFKGAIGEYIFVKLYQKFDGEKEFAGDLTSFDGENLVLDVLDKTRHKSVEIPLSSVAKAQTMVKF
ncbi:ribosome maturation factor RimP [Lactococcus protaetiae]|uniref:Ribosome maturation factor RimP n=1 Tax=Lactococcus protaetiae TaxID=2592653 RepID=A0A514Z8H7_9LACT|nr:ribosome maturation factor RimP [Lactococcus protaetiae]QDK70892.1 ribosome maturation factor RimP [Lactococcus protaetiae]